VRGGNRGIRRITATKLTHFICGKTGRSGNVTKLSNVIRAETASEMLRTGKSEYVVSLEFQTLPIAAK
jgi:hypothetical protein